MSIEEINQLKEARTFDFDITSVEALLGKLSINGKIALPIEKCASYFQPHSDIPVFDPEGTEIGTLCFTKDLGTVSLEALTENRFIAYLSEASYSDEITKYNFAKNYLVLSINFYEKYAREYQKTSAIWGGFFHDDADVSTITFTKPIPSINIVSKLELGRKIFYENCVRAIYQPYAFERFLKFYHLLELRFDYDVIEKIKLLRVDNDSEKIGELLNNYSDKEITRLRDIIFNHCTDIGAIALRLESIKQYPDIAFDLAFKFGSLKQSNPFINQEGKFYEFLSLENFDERRIKGKKLIGKNSSYNDFILNLTCYWIYRIRCSIAHNKIGEYVLSMNRESFLVDFGEPLLKEVIIQCFKKPTQN